MGRSRSSSSSWTSSWIRYTNPAYYLKRPKRLALLFMLFVCATLFVWDRQSLVSDHEEEILKLNDEVVRLQNMLDELKSDHDLPGGKVKFNSKSKVTTGKNDDSDDPFSLKQRDKVKNAMIHAWGSSEKYAWGHDELQPQTKMELIALVGLEQL